MDRLPGYGGCGLLVVPAPLVSAEAGLTEQVQAALQAVGPVRLALTGLRAESYNARWQHEGSFQPAEEDSMSITLSPEAQAKAAQIPDIAVRLERFIDEQYALEQWRAKRFRPEVADLVREAATEGTALKASGVDRDTLFARLLTLVESNVHGSQPR